MNFNNAQEIEKRITLCSGTYGKKANVKDNHEKKIEYNSTLAKRVESEFHISHYE